MEDNNATLPRLKEDIYNFKTLDMEKEEQQLHLNNIIKGIEEIQEESRALNYQQFTEEEQVKEAVYMNLQMIGQAAYQLSSGSDEASDLNFRTDILSGFRNARYNATAEVDHQMIWNVIKNDLEVIRDEAIEASAKLGIPSDDDELHATDTSIGNKDRTHEFQQKHSD